MLFGEKINKLRTEKGMTQDELAHAVGYKSRSSVAKIEAGERDAPQSMIVKLAKALDTTPSELMGFEKEMSSSDNNSDFASRLVQHRKELGVSQAEMARRLGTSRQTYNNYELGKREPDYEMLIRIANELRASIQALLTDIEEKRIPIPQDRSAIIEQIAALPEDRFQEMAAKLEFAGYINSKVH